MRLAFLRELEAIAEREPRVALLTGDLGYTVLDDFAARYPDRFYNVGVAEQNMLGIATGLAEAGLIPFVYSIATFASLRPYEFIRNGPVVHDLPVRIVGVGGGFAYGTNGISHFALEDVALMTVQPGLTVVAPADAPSAAAALRATWDVPGPVYYRLGKTEEQIVPPAPFEPGRARRLEEGEDLAFVALGPSVAQVLEAVSALRTHGVSCSVVLVESVAPLPEEDLADALVRVPLAITVEAHYANGGLGSLVGTLVAERRLGCRLIRSAVHSVPRGVTGSERFLLDSHGLSAPALTELALAALDRATA